MPATTRFAAPVASTSSGPGRYEHAPAWHDMLAVLQSTQQPLPDPQFEFVVPGWQLPDGSQHPAHVPLAHELLALPVLHAPPDAVPEELPPEELPPEDPLDEDPLDEALHDGPQPLPPSSPLSLAPVLSTAGPPPLLDPAPLPLLPTPGDDSPRSTDRSSLAPPPSTRPASSPEGARPPPAPAWAHAPRRTSPADSAARICMTSDASNASIDHPEPASTENRSRAARSARRGAQPHRRHTGRSERVRATVGAWLIPKTPPR
jgi:hypothetical protein